MDSDGLLPTARQTKQGRALGAPGAPCNADPSPYHPTPAWQGSSGLASPALSDWLGRAVRTVRSLDRSPGKGVPRRVIRCKTLQAAGVGVAAPHFSFALPSSTSWPPKFFPLGDTIPHPRAPGLG